MSGSDEQLRAENLQLRAEIDSLRAELAETNTGVLALYSELDEQAEQLRQASELKSRFLSYMTHEFRTPLGALRSISRILLDRMDGPLTDEQEKQMRFIQSSTEELTEMVNDLLDLAKVEAGRITVSPGWFELVDLFSALRGMFKPILTSESVNLIFVDAVGVPPIYNDNSKVAQILRNLISNAIKFTTEGEVRVSAFCQGDSTVVFTVSDTGIGIAKELQGALFQDFVQIDSSIQRRLRGTGLGLSLSKKLAVILGGDLSVESEIDKGSTFSLHLPISIPQGERQACFQQSDVIAEEIKTAERPTR